MKMEMTPRLNPRRGAEVKIGNVYSTKSGPAGYFVVINVIPKDGKWGKPYNNIVLLRFTMAGEIVRGLNEPEVYIQNHKDLIGYVKEMPTLEVVWYE